jgi:MFS family permease
LNGTIKAALARAGVRPLAPEDAAEWRAGWRVVLGAGVGLGTGVSLYLLLGSLFVTRITTEFGWSRGDLSLAGAASFLVAAAALAVIGRILDRVGFRPVVLVCVPVLSLIYLGLTQMNGSFALYVALLLAGGVVGGGTAGIVYTRPVIAAFDRQRGLALGLAASGTSLGSLALAPALAFVIGEYGWRAGAYGLIAVTLCIGLPLALALLGRARDPSGAVREEMRAGRQLAVGPQTTLAEARRGARFWLILLALVAVNVPGSGVIGQLGPLITDKGLSEVASGAVMSFYAGGLLVGRVATGLALDRMSAVAVAAVMTSVPAAGMALLIGTEPSFAIAAFAVALIGLQQGSEIDLLAFFVSRGFGFAHYGAIYGAIAMAGAASSAVGIALFGKVHDWTGNYDAALVIGAACFAAGAASFAGLSRVR